MPEYLVAQTFQTIHEKRGFVDPTIAARELTESWLLRRKVKKNILQHPTKEYLYEGVENVLQDFLDQGDHITIWTDDYPERIATSGLGKLRKGLSRKERHRFTFTHGEDKISLLPEVFDNALTKGIKTAVIVDNSEANLDQATEVIKQTGEGIKFHLAWINPEAPEIELPACISPEITQLSIPSIHSLTEFRKEHAGPFLWIVDFNETLVNTPAFMNGVTAAVADTLRSRWA